MTRRVDDYVGGWVRGIITTGQVNLLDELATLPRVAASGVTSLDVVFDGRPGSRSWKDWMLYLTRDLKSAFADRTFECFYDVVSNTA